MGWRAWKGVEGESVEREKRKKCTYVGKCLSLPPLSFFFWGGDFCFAHWPNSFFLFVHSFYSSLHIFHFASSSPSSSSSLFPPSHAADTRRPRVSPNRSFSYLSRSTEAAPRVATSSSMSWAMNPTLGAMMARRSRA